MPSNLSFTAQQQCTWAVDAGEIPVLVLNGDVGLQTAPLFAVLPVAILYLVRVIRCSTYYLLKCLLVIS